MKIKSTVVTPNLSNCIINAKRQNFDPKKYHKLLFDKQFFAENDKKRNYCKGVYYDESNELCVALNDYQMIVRTYDSSNSNFEKFNSRLICPDFKSEKCDKEIGGYYLRKAYYPDYLNEDIIYENYASQFTFPHKALEGLITYIKKTIKKSSEDSVGFTVSGRWFSFDAGLLICGLEILNSSSSAENDVKVFFPTEADIPNITIQCENMLYVLMGLELDEEDLEKCAKLGDFVSIIEKINQSY